MVELLSLGVILPNSSSSPALCDILSAQKQQRRGGIWGCPGALEILAKGLAFGDKWL